MTPIREADAAAHAGAPDLKSGRAPQQLTLNQRVQGSNPCTPTNDFNVLEAVSKRLARVDGRGEV